MIKRLSLVLVALGLLLPQANTQTVGKLFRYPDVSQTHIAFAYGGDIWTVPKTGGLAVKLSSPKGSEIAPKFSPDGSEIAFSGNYDGNIDIYVIPAQGGLPIRVTHHGMSDRIQDWFPDGKHLYYTSSMHSEKQRFSQFYSVPKEGGLPRKMPMAYGEFGSLSPDGKRIAYTDKSRVSRNWKRYKGGMAADIFIFDLETYASENITRHAANDEIPMWHQDAIYYLSDKGPEQRFNIWKYDISTKEHTQITKFPDYDVHTPSIGPEEIVFEAGGSIYLLNLENHQPQEIEISVATDMISIKSKKVAVQEQILNMDISPDGNRTVVEARGELLSLPARKGVIRNLSRTSGIAERYPAWSPNGQMIAYWSDRTGEYELTLRDLKNGGEEKTITKLGPGFRYNIYWSPDSKHVVFVDQTMTIYKVDIATGTPVKVDQDISLYESGLQAFDVSWSPDSRWIAYDKSLENGNSAIFIYDTKSLKVRQATSGFYSDSYPRFDPDGKYLYLMTNRNFDPLYSDFDNTWVYPNATQLALITLRKDVLSPLAPKNDTVAFNLEDEAVEGENEDEKKSDAKQESVVSVDIDFEDLERRLIILPPPAGNFGNLTATSGKIIFHRYPNSGSEEEKNAVKYFDLEDQEEHTIIKDVRGYAVAANGEKMLIIKQEQSGIIEVAKDQSIDDALSLNEMEMTVNPREEWKQIFNDAWRFERDFFYDRSMHGVDWIGLKEHYGKLIDHCMSRDDVNFVIGELIGELNASHTYRGGGDQEQPARKAVGYLGVDWTTEGGHFKVHKIIRGAAWDNEVRSALDMPGVNVAEGDFILAVNGVPLNEYTDPWGAFEGLAGKTVELSVNNKPTFDGARTEIVETMRSETRLRHLAWIEANRREVEEASDGKIGYIYVPSTGRDGQKELARQFYAQWNKEGLVIDERFNNGGQIPDRFIELLDRKPLAYWSVRDGKNWQWPPIANFGSMAMLANGWSGSGGDAFPDYFQKAGLGPVIGTRTWGGLIGISGSPSLIDGGGVTVPTFRMYNPDGTWFKEGYGVEPDIEVPEDPSELAKGNDTQLQAAIRQVLESIKKKGPIHPPPPGKEKRT